MSKLPSKREETLGGFIVHGVPFPRETDPDALAFLKKMAPIQVGDPVGLLRSIPRRHSN